MIQLLIDLLTPIFTSMGVSTTDVQTYVNMLSGYIYTIIGLMTGSLYAITMGPTTLDVPRAPMSPSTFSILFFLLGGVILAGLELLKARLD